MIQTVRKYSLGGVGNEPHNLAEDQLERVIEHLEHRCSGEVKIILTNENEFEMEYVENKICDVCHSADSQKGNELVCCSYCKSFVHQFCYGITSSPTGDWLCNTCTLCIRPYCILCPNKGGPMKSTRSGQKWVHVSCAVWIPEVSFDSVERMEPIIKISNMPKLRWELICVLCGDIVGACLQCTEATCKTAYHVTCAFQHGLEMKAIFDDENADSEVKLVSFCLKHSFEHKSLAYSNDQDSKTKKLRYSNIKKKNLNSAAKFQEIKAKLKRHFVDSYFEDVITVLNAEPEIIKNIYQYWKVKFRNDLATIPSKPQEAKDQDNFVKMVSSFESSQPSAQVSSSSQVDEEGNIKENSKRSIENKKYRKSSTATSQVENTSQAASVSEERGVLMERPSNKRPRTHSDSDFVQDNSHTKQNLRTTAGVKDYARPSKNKSKENKKNDYVPIELIVPQRQAAKKAEKKIRLSNYYF